MQKKKNIDLGKPFSNSQSLQPVITIELEYNEKQEIRQIKPKDYFKYKGSQFFQSGCHDNRLIQITRVDQTAKNKNQVDAAKLRDAQGCYNHEREVSVTLLFCFVLTFSSFVSSILQISTSVDLCIFVVLFCHRFYCKIFSTYLILCILFYSINKPMCVENTSVIKYLAHKYEDLTLISIIHLEY